MGHHALLGSFVCIGSEIFGISQRNLKVLFCGFDGDFRFCLPLYFAVYFSLSGQIRGHDQKVYDQFIIDRDLEFCSFPDAATVDDRSGRFYVLFPRRIPYGIVYGNIRRICIAGLDSFLHY